MEKHSRRFVKLYPWFSGLTADLLFYIAVDTLFLDVVKHFSAAQIVSLVSLSQLICIVLQFPLLWVVKRIGNTASFRTGAFFLLLSALLITLGRTYTAVLLGRIFHDASGVFKSASVVALENDLELIGRRDDFVRLRTSATTLYSVITMLISFVASYLFNLNPYLPMLGCIATCAAGFVLSLLMRDCSPFDKISAPRRSRERVRISVGGLVLITVLAYAVFYAIVSNGQNEGKLFIQQELFLSFDVERTALIIGAVVCVSRIVRVISNVVFAKLYARYRACMGIALSVLLGLSIALMLCGSYIPSILWKTLVMAMGYTVILFVRDPFLLYIQDVIFENTPKEQHQTLLTVLEFGVKIAGAGMGLGFSAMLIDYPMEAVMGIMLLISAVEVILCLRLGRIVWRAGHPTEP